MANNPYGTLPGEHEIIRLVLELRAAGLTIRGISAELARRRTRGRTGAPLGPTQIANIVRAERAERGKWLD